MKIIHLLPNKTWGATEDMVLGLARMQLSEGNSVTVMCKDLPALTGPLRRAGIDVVTAPMRGGVDVLAPIRLSKILRTCGGRAVVHVNKFGDAVIASRAKSLAGTPDVKVVLTRHIYSKGVDSMAGSAIYPEVDAIIFNDTFALEKFREGKPQISEEKLHVIPAAVALPRSVSGPQPVRDSSCTTLLLSGDLTAEKGLDTLIKALPHLRPLNYRVIVIGEGQARDVMPAIRESRRLGVSGRIDWRGAKASVHTAAAEADLAVAPDRFTVRPGNEVLTYLAHGLPVVASDVSFHKAVAGDNNAVVFFEEGNPEALAIAVEKALEMKEGEQNLKSIPFGVYAQNVSELYNSLFR